MLPVWVGGNIVPGLIDARPITTKGWRKYLIKGVGEAGWDEFSIPYRWREGQGKVSGKRCGTSENIGSIARKRWKNRSSVRHDTQFQEATL
jgi:hypothetical protein